MKMRVQDPPFTVQIELVEGCNLRCPFCGIAGVQAVQGKGYKFTTVERIDEIGRQIAASGWNPRVEIAMHGEPSMHPQFVDCVSALRKRLPKTSLMMTSNGVGYLRDKNPVETIKRVMTAGLNILALDDYRGENIVPKIREAVRGANEALPFRTFEYPDQREASPHTRRRPTDHDVVFMRDLRDAAYGTHSNLTNQGGVAAPPNDALTGKRCARPFRELAVRWDGSVAICCNDWTGHYGVGRLEDGLEAAWQSDAMNAARQKLYRGERDFGPCKGCDQRSYRLGFLPDKFGKETLPLPDEETHRVIAEVLAEPRLSPLIPRAWHRD